MKAFGEQFQQRSARKPELLAIPLGTFGRRRRNHLEFRAQFGIEDRSNRGHRNRMRFAHIAAANDSNADIRHQRAPPKSNCNRLQNELDCAHLHQAEQPRRQVSITPDTFGRTWEIHVNL